MIVAVSGSQGTGKSKILAGLKERGHNIIERKTARSALDEMGCGLSEIYADAEKTQEFQDILIERKFEDEQVAFHDDAVWFTERTYADVFTYALLVLGKFNEYNDWVNSYYEKCLEYSQYYTLTYYVKAGSFTVHHDGVRGSNPHYSRLIDVTMQDITSQMIPTARLQFIHTPIHEQRVAIIEKQTQAFFIHDRNYRESINLL